MNIQQAKQQIKNAITAYRTRDEYGRPVIPQHRQRPVFLLGAPGIGKTAIMEQIAQELGIPLVSYSMTHHTRQSALGLPYIVEREYNGKQFRVSEYTMSEIIAAVYEKSKQTGIQEGILFLDEINCVSETLAPAMLQFLQYKVFGQHRVPEGWIVVTAGNPPEYNQSVREFDMVTWDRLKRIDVTPDYDVWRGWAINHGAHQAVLSYLDICRADFYQVESTVDGKSFVTPRGWIDLSDMLKLYEQHELPVSEQLMGQYLQNAQISKSFANYYDLWMKYRSDYQIDSILSGKPGKVIKQRATDAKFDERITLIGLLLDAILSEVSHVMRERDLLQAILPVLRAIRVESSNKHFDALAALDKHLDEQKQRLDQGVEGNMLSQENENTLRGLIVFLQDAQTSLHGKSGDTDIFSVLKGMFDMRMDQLKETALLTGQRLENLFAFAEKVFGDGQEMLIIVTELTAANDAARFIAQYGSTAYFRHNKELLFYERQIETIREIDNLDLEL